MMKPSSDEGLYDNLGIFFWDITVQVQTKIHIINQIELFSEAQLGEILSENH